MSRAPCQSIGTEPRGQAMLEALALVVPLSLCALGLATVFRISLQESEAIGASRSLLDSCRLDPQGCAQWAQVRAVQGLPSPSIFIDRPPADIGGKRPLERLGDALRTATATPADQLFQLPDPRQLIRVSVTEEQAVLGGLLITTQRRLASHTENWGTPHRSVAQARTQSGAEPSEPLRLLIAGVHAPVTRGLMPLFESLGLESGSRPFSQGFHHLDWMKPFPGVQAGAEVRP